jgi:hypothetical protein
MVECLLSKHKALSPTKKRKNKKPKQNSKVKHQWKKTRSINDQYIHE